MELRPLLAKAPKLVNFFLEKEWAQQATEKSIGMVDVPPLSVPTLAEELRDHRARYFDLPGLEAMSPEQRQKWCSSCGIPSPATTTPPWCVTW